MRGKGLYPGLPEHPRSGRFFDEAFDDVMKPLIIRHFSVSPGYF
jgi:hypothetical protein